jgi:hypothetical protein
MSLPRPPNCRPRPAADEDVVAIVADLDVVAAADQDVVPARRPGYPCCSSSGLVPAAMERSGLDVGLFVLSSSHQSAPWSEPPT